VIIYLSEFKTAKAKKAKKAKKDTPKGTHTQNSTRQRVELFCFLRVLCAREPSVRGGLIFFNPMAFLRNLWG
jgi:hypothetical protein